MGTVKAFSMRDSEGVCISNFTPTTSQTFSGAERWEEQKSKLLESTQPQEPVQQLHQVRSWAGHQRKGLIYSLENALPSKLHRDGGGPLASRTQLAFYSHITGYTFLQTYHLPLPSYNYQRVKRTLNFTAYIAVQLHENGRLSMLSLAFCLFEIWCFKKKHHW